MKRLFGGILSILLIAGLCVPAMAEEAATGTRVTAQAHLLALRPDAVVVCLDDPGEVDASGDVWEIPTGAGTTFADRDGRPLQNGEILPGQAVRVSFRSTYETAASTGERRYRPVLCDTVQLLEDVVPVASTVNANALEPWTGIGTVLAVGRDAQTGRDLARIYVEAADDGSAGSVLTCALYNVNIHDVNHLRIMPYQMQPYVRVYFKGGAASPDTLLLLAPGEQVVVLPE